MNYDEIVSLPPNFKGMSHCNLETFHMVDLTWSQWTSILTHNIDTKHIKEIHLQKHSQSEFQEIKIPYQIFGESLSLVTELTFKGLKATNQQISTLFDNLKVSMKLKKFEMDDLINISGIDEGSFTKVVANLEVVTFRKAKISSKQLTSLLTHVLNNGISN